MKKRTLFKRACALFIDLFCIGVFFELCKRFPLFRSINKTTMFFILVFFLPYSCKDVVFKNASIGKFLMGLVVVDEKWEAPSFVHSVKRTLLSYIVGYFTLCKAFFINKDYYRYFDNEPTLLKARVIERKKLKEFKEKAKTETGFDIKMMNCLYEDEWSSQTQNTGDGSIS